MGLTTWKNAPDGRVQKSDTVVAKNYLSEKEVTQLNQKGIRRIRQVPLNPRP